MSFCCSDMLPVLPSVPRQPGTCLPCERSSLGDEYPLYPPPFPSPPSLLPFPLPPCLTYMQLPSPVRSLPSYLSFSPLSLSSLLNLFFVCIIHIKFPLSRFPLLLHLCIFLNSLSVQFVLCGIRTDISSRGHRGLFPTESRCGM